MWYKVLREDLTHHDFKYKLGLNVDHIPFYPFDTCEPGGLYYTNKEHLFKFLYFGDLIADIEIPEDAKVYKDPEGTKWKADKLIVKSMCKIEDHPLLQDPDWCLAAVKENGYNLKHIKNQTEEQCIAAVKENSSVLEYVKNQTHKICMAAVSHKGSSLEYVENQTYDICLTAVRQNGYALQHVKNQTDELCLEAVKQYGKSVRFVKKQTYEICVAAARQDFNAIYMIDSDLKPAVIRSIEFIQN